MSRWVCVLLLFPVSSACGDPPDFEQRVAPLLVRRCLECHQEKSPSGSLSFATREGLKRGGDSGAVFVPGNPNESYLLQRVLDGEMPPLKQGRPQTLPPEEAAVLRDWIASGAAWPEGRTLELYERTSDVRGGRDWWSLQPVRRPDIPRDNDQRPLHPVDAFLRRELASHRLRPAPPADRRTLLRRVYYDLIGLPPTEAQIAAFVADKSADAWERVVDELLASPHYGERWARYWLDLVRYADTSGYERDQEKPFAWKYRDWVVRALNDNKPYDRFVVEQLAGDELPDRSEETVIATGFLRLGTWNDEPNDPEDYQYERLEDLVHVTSSAFLGLTVKCARCHDHKFDPLYQEDYYRMGAAFWAGPIGARDRALLGGPSSEELGFDEILGWTDLQRDVSPLHVLKNGERAHPLEAAEPASLSLIPELFAPFAPPEESARTSQRRLHLARWIVDPRHPLTARVMVNRLWLHHFGQGLVRSPNNFGFTGERPTHPELLDWLAAEFVDSGWNAKSMHRLLLTSEAYRQASLHPESERYDALDSGNRLWWRAERRRLDAEALHDSMLFVSGELDRKLGGPSFRPTISAEALEGLSMKSAAWTASPSEEQNRRGLYTYTKRGLLPPLLTAFDFCDASQPVGQRDVTIVAPQALALLNDDFAHRCSNHLAQRTRERISDETGQIRSVWSSVLGRQPTAGEERLAAEHLAAQRARFADSESAEQADLQALSSLCLVVMNTNEFAFLD